MAGHGGFGSWRHLAGRFFAALSPVGPPKPLELWALEAMTGPEADLWRRMSGPDRRHAVAVAREAVARLEADKPDRAFLTAALFHDVGKVEAALGTFARVAVTLAAISFGRDRLMGWAGPLPSLGQGGSSSLGTPCTRVRLPLRSRVGLYLAHDRVGAQLLQAAGAEPFAVSWAREHHMPPGRWSVDLRLGEALKAADGD
jgi:hypothetical protein